ncbi:unnamed protein product, partial [Rotaria sp. Silwood1]
MSSWTFFLIFSIVLVYYLEIVTVVDALANTTDRDIDKIGHIGDTAALPIYDIFAENLSTDSIYTENHIQKDIESTEHSSTLSTHSADFENKETTVPTDKTYYTQEESTERASTVPEQSAAYENDQTTESANETYYTQEESTESTSIVSVHNTEIDSERTTESTNETYYAQKESTEPAFTISEQNLEFENEETTVPLHEKNPEAT